MKRLTTLILGAVALALAASPASAELKKKYRVATEGAYAPFNWVDPDGSLKGFDVDIAKELCARIKVECEIVAQDWDGIIPGLLAKKYDMIVASMSITEERKQVVDFTGKYYNTPAKFIAKEGASFEFTDAGMAGKVIGTQRATIHENFLRDNFPSADIRVYATQDEANADLASGRLDLVLADSVALDEGFLKTDAGKGFAFVGPDYTDPKWFGDGAGIAIRKGETDLVDAFNKAIAQIRSDGTYAAINAKYFDFDVYGK